ncbi:MAG TPA: thiamine pyrophosphate-dependent enzyme [Pseudonocardiaceae bacterium]|nr:thiamine pyrophosphate-dependent enzyme [Pseudonocardiaceae bacterium]
MKSIDATAAVQRHVPDDVIVVAGLGRSAWCARELWGRSVLILDALGDVLPTAIGLSVAYGPSSDRNVLSMEGDGSFLFGVHGLVTLAACRHLVGRFLAVILDNTILESAGGLPTLSYPLRWDLLCAAHGLAYAQATTVPEVDDAMREIGGVGVLRLVVTDAERLPTPADIDTGSENVVGFRRMLADRDNKPLPSPAQKW